MIHCVKLISFIKLSFHLLRKFVNTVCPLVFHFHAFFLLFDFASVTNCELLFLYLHFTSCNTTNANRYSHVYCDPFVTLFWSGCFILFCTVGTLCIFLRTPFIIFGSKKNNALQNNKRMIRISGNKITPLSMKLLVN